MAWRDRQVTVNLLAEMARKQEHVATKLAEMRERMDLSQEDAARRARVGYRSYQRWEAGEAMPHPENLKKLARAFSVRLDDLLPPDPVVENNGTELPEDRLARIESLLEEIRDALLSRSADAALAEAERLTAEQAEAARKDQREADETSEDTDASSG